MKITNEDLWDLRSEVWEILESDMDVFPMMIKVKELLESKLTSDNKQSAPCNSGGNNKPTPKLPEFSMELWNEFIYSLEGYCLPELRTMVEMYHNFIAGKIGRLL